MVSELQSAFLNYWWWCNGAVQVTNMLYRKARKWSSEAVLTGKIETGQTKQSRMKEYFKKKWSHCGKIIQYYIFRSCFKRGKLPLCNNNFHLLFPKQNLNSYLAEECTVKSTVWLSPSAESLHREVQECQNYFPILNEKNKTNYACITLLNQHFEHFYWECEHKFWPFGLGVGCPAGWLYDSFRLAERLLEWDVFIFKVFCFSIFSRTLGEKKHFLSSNSCNVTFYVRVTCKMLLDETTD